MTTANADVKRGRSRAVTTWLALVGGTLGLHRFYLYGLGDVLGWLTPWPTLIGVYGFWRMREFGVDDPRGALLVLLLGAMVTLAMLQVMVYGLTGDTRWAERHGPAPAGRVGAAPGEGGPTWPTYVAVGLALAIGAAAAMATIAFAAQQYFESRAEISGKTRS